MEVSLNITNKDLYRLERTLGDILKAIENLTNAFSDMAKAFASYVVQKGETRDAFSVLAGLTFWCVLIWSTSKVACKAIDYWSDRNSPKRVAHIEYRNDTDAHTKEETYKPGYPHNPRIGESWKGTFTMYFEESFDNNKR